MKYIANTVFLILLTAGWNSLGKEFPCEGKEKYEELKWDVQNLSIDPEFDASIRLRLFYCQMHYGEDLEAAFQNLKQSAELGDITSNYILAQYLLTGGWEKTRRFKAGKRRYGNLKKP